MKAIYVCGILCDVSQYMCAICNIQSSTEHFFIVKIYKLLPCAFVLALSVGTPLCDPQSSYSPARPSAHQSTCTLPCPAPGNQSVFTSMNSPVFRRHIQMR